MGEQVSGEWDFAVAKRDFKRDACGGQFQRRYLGKVGVEACEDDANGRVAEAEWVRVDVDTGSRGEGLDDGQREVVQLFLFFFVGRLGGEPRGVAPAGSAPGSGP